jgi:hypothetical protein
LEILVHDWPQNRSTGKQLVDRGVLE